MAIIKFINNKVSLIKTINYICKEEKTINKIISAKDCIAENAYEEMITIKKQFNKLVRYDLMTLQTYELSQKKVITKVKFP